MPANRKNLGSDLKKVDAHVIQPHEYEEAPEWTDEQIASATVVRGRGRPALGDAVKVPIKLRLDPDVLEIYKATGKGWQTRMQEDIAKAALRLKASLPVPAR